MSEYKCYFKNHGKFQTELKVKYPVADKKNKYSVELFIFSPKVLAVNNKSYGIKTFLSDIRIMTRLSTPEIQLPRLISPVCAESPLIRIKNELGNTLPQQKIKTKKIIYELRTLANIIRVELRKNRLFLRKKIDNDTDIDLLSGWLLEFNTQISDFIRQFRELRSLFINPEIDESLIMAYKWTDESISLTLQREAGIFFRLCQKRDEIRNFSDYFTKLIDNEIEHRTEKGYTTGIREPEKKSIGELLIYRENLLKKWSQSAMYLNVTRSRTPARIGQIIAGSAAAVAMGFAVTASILTSRFFPANSTAWALAAVVAYIFKDRIKEVLRSGLKTLFPGKIPDQMTVLKDSSVQQRSGHTSLFVKFTNENHISEEIKRKRYRTSKPFKELLPDENVIYMRHDVVLDGAKFNRNHQRMESVTEIIRLELHKFLQLMDDPDQIYYYTDGETIHKKMLRRVYHLNIVIKLCDIVEKDERLLKYRVILNRDGIIRIERPESEDEALISV